MSAPYYIVILSKPHGSVTPWSVYHQVEGRIASYDTIQDAEKACTQWTRITRGLWQAIVGESFDDKRIDDRPDLYIISSETKQKLEELDFDFPWSECNCFSRQPDGQPCLDCPECLEFTRKTERQFIGMKMEKNLLKFHG